MTDTDLFVDDEPDILCALGRQFLKGMGREKGRALREHRKGEWLGPGMVDMFR